MSNPACDLRERVWTVPTMPFLDPQKALNWVLGREAADWKMPALCPRCLNGRAIMSTFQSPGGNVWFSCSSCGTRSFYEIVAGMGAETGAEFQRITAQCGGGEIDLEWADKIGMFIGLAKACEERVTWSQGRDAGFTLETEEAVRLWETFLKRSFRIENKRLVHLRLQYSAPGRLAAIVPYSDSFRDRRMPGLPALYFDNLGPAFNVDADHGSWKQHLVIGANWDEIHVTINAMEGFLDRDSLTPVRLSERPLLPLLLDPPPVRYITVLFPGAIEMLEAATSFPPSTSMAVLSPHRDRRPSVSLDSMVGKRFRSKKKQTISALMAASNGAHAHPATRACLRKILT